MWWREGQPCERDLESTRSGRDGSITRKGLCRHPCPETFVRRLEPHARLEMKAIRQRVHARARQLAAFPQSLKDWHRPKARGLSQSSDHETDTTLLFTRHASRPHPAELNDSMRREDADNGLGLLRQLTVSGRHVSFPAAGTHEGLALSDLYVGMRHSLIGLLYSSREATRIRTLLIQQHPLSTSAAYTPNLSIAFT